VNKLVFAGAGITLGAALTYAAFLLAGFGHGTFVPLALVASPLLLLAKIQSEFFVPAMFAAPFYWGLLGWSATRPMPRTAAALLVLQYVGAIGIVMWSQEGRTAFMRMTLQAPVLVAATVLTYFFVHIWLWRTLYLSRRTHARSAELYSSGRQP
jgi:hypothetical protein